MKTLIAIAAVLGATTGSNVFADSIHSVLEKDRANATSGFNVVVNDGESAPWTIQDYVEKFKAEYEASNSESASVASTRANSGVDRAL